MMFWPHWERRGGVRVSRPRLIEGIVHAFVSVPHRIQRKRTHS